MRASAGALFSLALAAVVLAGCAAKSSPTAIHHLLFIELKDHGESTSLKDDCDKLLKPIPGVIGYSCGRHVDTGRAAVDSNYDLALEVVFADRSAYQAYLVHANHTALVERWKSRFASMRRFDFGTE